MSADARRRAEARRAPTPLGELARGELELEQRLDSLEGLEYVLLRFAILKRGDAVQASYGRLPVDRLAVLEGLAGERGLRSLRDALADTAAQIDAYLERDVVVGLDGGPPRDDSASLRPLPGVPEQARWR